jgi:hypothetical protein
MEAMLVTLVAEDAEILSRVDMEAALERVDRALKAIPPVLRAAYKMGLFLLEYEALLRDFRPFSRLPLTARLHHVTRWEHSRLPMKRNLFLLLRVVALTSFLQDPTLLELTGYGDAMHRRTARPEGAAGAVELPCRVGESS